MNEHPLTDAQIENLRQRARQIYQFHYRAAPPDVALALGEMVLPGGRLGDTVSMDVRSRIAEEERPEPVV